MPTKPVELTEDSVTGGWRPFLKPDIVLIAFLIVVRQPFQATQVFEQVEK